MPEISIIKNYHRVAAEVREIAQGIYDFDERQRVIQMANAFECLAAQRSGASYGPTMNPTNITAVAAGQN